MEDIFSFLLHRVQTVLLRLAFVAFAAIVIGSWFLLGVVAICVENFKPFLRFVFDAVVNVFVRGFSSSLFIRKKKRQRQEKRRRGGRRGRLKDDGDEGETEKDDDDDDDDDDDVSLLTIMKTRPQLFRRKQRQQQRHPDANNNNRDSPLVYLLQTHPEIFTFHICPRLDKNISNFAACSRECFEASIKAKSRLPTLPHEISRIDTVEMCKLALDRGLDVNNRQNVHALIRGNHEEKQHPESTIAIIRHLVNEKPMVKQKILKRDPECVRNASYNHSDKVVKYLVEQCEAKFDESACLWASLLGNIKALRYLREVKKCPWNKAECLRAAAHGVEDDKKRRKICEWIEKQPFDFRV
jgi:hypothetical protein